MSVRAQWFEAVVVPPLDDPFSNFVEQPQIPKIPTAVEDVGTPIDLSSTEPQLRRRLIELVNGESSLHAAGVRCAIRDRPDTNCCACPIRGRDEKIKDLCANGIEQEQVVTTLAIHRDRQQ